MLKGRASGGRSCILLAARLAILCAALAPSPATPAGEERCLTGNGPAEKNVRLKGGGYRVLWAGTRQPASPGDPAKRDLTPFSKGELTDGDERVSLPMVNRYTEKVSLGGYTWGPDGYEIEVDLGQVCEVARFDLVGTQKWMLCKAYYPTIKRWLPLARGTTSVTLQGLRTRRLRVEAGGLPCADAATFSEFRVWGDTLEKGAEESLPAPPPPDEPIVPYQALHLQPAPVAPVAPDPFVLPQPQEMLLGQARLTLRRASVVPSENAEIAEIARRFAEQVSALADVELAVGPPQPGPTVWLGLAGDKGPCGDLAARLRIGPDAIKPEGYALEVTANGVVLVGRDLEGLIWATKTFLFLMRPEVEGGISLPTGHVRDFPRSPYRIAFGYPGWFGEFKAGLLSAMAALKSNMIELEVDKNCEAIARQNRIRRILGAALFPQSACGASGDMLEIAPRQRPGDLDPSRLSACCSHTDFWPNMLKAFPQEKCTVPGTFVCVGYDEIMHNPWMVCPRCRARGLSQREMLLDTFLKAYRYLTARGYGLALYATGFQAVSPAFDMFLDIPTENVLVFNYDRPEQNRTLSARGLPVVAGTGSGIVHIAPDSPVTAGVVWNWDSAERPAMMSGTVPRMVMQAEENWSSATGKVAFKSPEWEARLNRAMQFVRCIIDHSPLDVPGAKREYFTADISKQANRTLQDDVYADGQGWLDEGPTRDLRHLPTGKQVFYGIPYDICGKAIIVAGPGSADGDLPDQVLDIPIGRKAAELVFLHTCAKPVWSNLNRMILLLGFYRIRYDDGTFVAVPVNYSQHLLEWLRPFGYRKMEFEPVRQPVADATVAWRGSTEAGHDVTLYAMSWRNPYPEKIIQAVDVLASARTESNNNRLCLVALTGRAVTPVDIKAAALNSFKPVLRRYRPRPPLPDGVVALDLTRRTTPPPLVAFSRSEPLAWQTHDRWVQARVSNLSYEKWELAYGVYSALNPDDEPWRCGGARYEGDPRGSGTLTLSFKKPLPLRGIGVKGIMQGANCPGFFPVDFEVSIQTQGDRKWRPIGQAKGHNGEEGEERWVFPGEETVTAVKIVVTEGDGLSAIYLYARPGTMPPARFESDASLADTENPSAEKPDEDIVEELEAD